MYLIQPLHYIDEETYVACVRQCNVSYRTLGSQAGAFPGVNKSKYYFSFRDVLFCLFILFIYLLVFLLLLLLLLLFLGPLPRHMEALRLGVESEL